MIRHERYIDGKHKVQQQEKAVGQRRLQKSWKYGEVFM
jgi:hypothetical protein